MDIKSAFNAAVCIIGIGILLIHVINILLKKDRRKDENLLLIFVIFTIVHFITYLTFTFVKVNYTSDTLIMAFYTTFYIMNNIQLLLLFTYALSYIPNKKNVKDVLAIINLSIFVVFVVLDIINVFTHMFFSSKAGVYIRSDTMIASQGYQFIAFFTVFILAVFNKKLRLMEKISFSVYCLLPLVAILIQNFLPGYAIGYLSVIISIEILFLFVNVTKNMRLMNEEKKIKDAEIKIMMSQIQPHFIYNALASISTLIKIDPDKAQKALDNFTEYLRANLSSLNDTGLILFSDELKHIQTYLSLEEMRFDDRLNVIYDIQVKDFLVPPLSIQPIVENAVKHGMQQKIEGCTLIIKTYETSDAYIVEINDDGVGFNINEIDSKNSIGLNNVKYRIASMCSGDIKIDSEIDKGTNVTYHFYK